jgi:hypothetical protein
MMVGGALLLILGGVLLLGVRARNVGSAGR